MDRYLRASPEPECWPLLQSPPPTPRELSDPRPGGSKKIKYEQLPTPHTQSNGDADIKLWENIFAMAKQKRGPYKWVDLVCEPNPSRVPSLERQSRSRRSSAHTISTEGSSNAIALASSFDDSESDGSAREAGSIMFLGTILVDPLRNSGPSDVDIDAEVFAEKFADQTCRIDAIFPDRYKLCSKSPDSECKYNRLSTSSHTHVPSSKCSFTSENLESFSPPHEHCISRGRPLPGQAGPCLLAEKLGRNHVCCYWADKDMIDWPQTLRQDYDQGKIIEARRLRLRIYNKCSFINRKDQLLPVAPFIFKKFDGQGLKLLLHDLEVGVYNKELQSLKDWKMGKSEDVMSIDDSINDIRMQQYV